MNDDFFTGLDNTKPYFKCAFEGFAGCGKTYTSAQVAIGLHKRIKSKKPIVIFDTERSAKFLKPLFEDAGIQVLLRESRSLADLKEVMKRMRGDKISDILMIDSLTHVYENFLQAYKDKPTKYGKPAKTRLEFQDWGIIKPAWKAEFSDPFVMDEYHAIFCGRAGYEYDNEKNEETGKREIFKTGIKMKVEGETAYEPDMLILMERFEEILGEEKEVWREATVIKDRSTLIDGKTFKNPTYNDFSPCIEALLHNPVPRNVIVEGDTGMLFKTEEDKFSWKKERDKAVEELNGLLDRIAPGSGKVEKQLKSDLLVFAFGSASETEIADMKPEAIREGYKKIGEEAVKRGIAVVINIEGKNRLVSKDFLQKEMQEEEVKEDTVIVTSYVIEDKIQSPVSDTEEKITNEQTKKMFAVWNEYMNVSNNDQNSSSILRKKWMKNLFGEGKDSSTKLTKAEASHFIEVVQYEINAMNRAKELAEDVFGPPAEEKPKKGRPKKVEP